MSEFTCLVFSAVVASITSVHAGSMMGHSNIQDFNVMVSECAMENKVTDNELHRAMVLEDVTGINPCFWTCCFKKAGFLDKNGRYILETGLAYARNLIKGDDAYTILEHVARQCETVPEGTTKCDKGAMIASCFAEQLYLIQFFSKR